jgi:hypothetical protein
MPAPADAAAARTLQAGFQYALFAHHSKYVMDLLQPEGAAKLSCLVRIASADLARLLQQQHTEQLLDRIWEQHRVQLPQL